MNPWGSGEESSKLGRHFRRRGTKATFFVRLCLIKRERERDFMSKKIVLVAFLAAATLPSVTHAQGTVRGAEEGAREGYRQGGPVGEILGGAAGAVTGTIGGILGVEERPRFREYVIREGRPSHQYGGDFRVGALLPDRDIAYYEVPAEFKASQYRYTVVNGHAVLVDPITRRVVEILD
jgi:Protein of unknown function (DUF1236)